MATSMPPFIECEQIHAGLAVSDISAAVDFYTKRLGFQLGFTWGEPPTFAGVNLGKVQMFLRKGTPVPEGCVVYFLVGDADQLYEFHRANGVEVAQEIGDRGIRNPGLRRTRRAWTLSFVWASPVQRRATDQNPTGGRARTAGEASGGFARGPGKTQTHEREQLLGRDDPAYERRRRTPHANNPALHSGVEEETWH